jgi:hypothetical protein
VILIAKVSERIPQLLEIVLVAFVKLFPVIIEAGFKLIMGLLIAIGAAIGAAAMSPIAMRGIIIGPVVVPIIAVSGIAAYMDVNSRAIVPETNMPPAPGFRGGGRCANQRQGGHSENDTQDLHHSLLSWCYPNMCFRQFHGIYHDHFMRGMTLTCVRFRRVA